MEDLRIKGCVCAGSSLASSDPLQWDERNLGSVMLPAREQRGVVACLFSDLSLLGFRTNHLIGTYYN